MVRDHVDDLRIEISPPCAPEHGPAGSAPHARPAQRRAAARPSIGKPPLHAEAARRLRHEAPLEVVGRAAFHDGRPSACRTSALGSVAYWSASRMFAPCSNRKRDTPATIPGRPGPEHEPVGGAAVLIESRPGRTDSFSAPSAVMRKLSSTRSPPPPPSTRRARSRAPSLLDRTQPPALVRVGRLVCARADAVRDRMRRLPGIAGRPRALADQDVELGEARAGTAVVDRAVRRRRAARPSSSS